MSVQTATQKSILETWSQQGSVTSSESTYKSIQHALGKYEWPKNVNYEVYLQGSYRNTTNIRGDSDVDVVIQLNSTFKGNVSALTTVEKELYGKAYQNATYLWTHFRADVLKALQNHYGESKVTSGNKSIKVETPYLPADVVPCMQYRKYERFLSLSNEQYIEGMRLYATRDKRWIINYPKIHYKNGVSKNSSASKLFKSTVRMFKNARSHLVEEGEIDRILAPSYFLECLIYNVPDWAFGVDYEQTFGNVIVYLGEAEMQNFMCQNGQLKLFGDSPEQWSQKNAIELLIKLARLYKSWR